MQMEKAYRSFTELKTWQKARALRKAVSFLVKGLPPDEKYRLADQVIRSSRAPSANIAEGYGRFHEKDNARFCRMASGSLNETMDHLSVAYDEGYISRDEFKLHWNMAEETLRLVHGYIRYLRNIESRTNFVSEPEGFYGLDMDDDFFTDSPSDL